MGLFVALLFVLGLMGVAVWFAKRFGGGKVNPRARIAVEIVQRVPLGPKAGLAVVRVGEKVMAISIGPDGIRPLFELDEADRQHVIATSQIATPFANTADARIAFAKLLPGSLGRVLTRQTLGSASLAMENAAAAAASVAKSVAESVQSEIPSFLPEHVVPTKPAALTDREFQSVLNIAMSGATRLAVFAGLVVLSGSAFNSPAGAQAVPPVVPPVVQSAPPVQPVALPVTNPVSPPVTAPASQNPVTNSASPAATSTIVPTETQATVPGAPVTPALPPVAPPTNAAAFVLPKNVSRPARTAQVRPAGARAVSGAVPTAAQTKTVADSGRPAPRKAATPVAQSITAARSATQTNAAPPATIAGSDDALAKMIPQMDLKMGDGKDGGLRLSGTVGIVVMMGLLTLIPTLLLMMTGFTRILIVLHFLKQAMGTQSAPPAQLLAAMALLLTGFVMAPTLTEMNRTALEPWMDGKMTQVQMLQTGVKPMRVFMLKQTRETDLKTFIELSRLPRPNTVDDVPLHVLMSAFVASELRTAFQIGFMIYLPFIVIDAVVASVLMSMGMFMLPPAMISMPFKLLLFVLVDGWGLIIHSLVKSFH